MAEGLHDRRRSSTSPRSSRSSGALPVAARSCSVRSRSCCCAGARRRGGRARRRHGARPYAAVHIAKAAVDRPRPPDPLVDTRPARPIRRATRPTRSRGSRSRSSLSRVLPGLARGSRSSPWRSCSRSPVGADAASTCARTTSPTSSAAAGSARRCSSLCGIVALVVGYLRHNGRRRARTHEQQSITYSRRGVQRRVSASPPTSAFILVPAWTSYSARLGALAAAFLTLYVLGRLRRPRGWRAAPRSSGSGTARRLTIRGRETAGAPYNPSPCPLRPRRTAAGLDLGALDAITDAVESAPACPRWSAPRRARSTRASC